MWTPFRIIIFLFVVNALKSLLPSSVHPLELILEACFPSTIRPFFELYLPITMRQLTTSPPPPPPISPYFHTVDLTNLDYNDRPRWMTLVVVTSVLFILMVMSVAVYVMWKIIVKTLTIPVPPPPPPPPAAAEQEAAEAQLPEELVHEELPSYSDEDED